MKRRPRLSVQISQREVHSWNPFSDEIVETRNKVGVDVRYPGQRVVGRLTGNPKTGITGKQKQKDPTPRGERVMIRVAGTTERVAAKAIKASGHQFVVRDRDGHPRGAFATAEEADAAAGDADTVFDRIEGRNINRRKRNDDIPDPGVYTAQVSEQWTIGA